VAEWRPRGVAAAVVAARGAGLPPRRDVRDSQAAATTGSLRILPLLPRARVGGFCMSNPHRAQAPYVGWEPLPIRRGEISPGETAPGPLGPPDRMTYSNHSRQGYP
jgi:hypothetical protein